MSLWSKPINIAPSLLCNVGEPEFTFSQLFFSTGAGRDIRELIFEFLNMGNLVRFGNVDRENRDCVQGYLRRRLRRLLKRFLGAGSFSYFASTLV